MPDDAPWYEAAHLVGITNALNVAADGLDGAGGTLLAPVGEGAASAKPRETFDEIRAFYAREDVPLVFRVLAQDPVYLADFWAALRRAFDDNVLTRRFKEALAFAVSLTTRSAFGTPFHLAEMRRLGCSDAGVFEVVGVTQMFSSYTKVADMLALEPDMGDMAPSDPSPPPCR